ncbi:MAG: hypothetical protein MRERV_8c039 [Mycoplasmataceae bacterium RV_VA103A]|nr:MAG: hypothetical protein MRERV_8c039 [Mycoplasmataceae bacterium RV_VA103A]
MNVFYLKKRVIKKLRLENTYSVIVEIVLTKLNIIQ